MMKRWGESGNIFFTLFGAVALVGVVGAATSTLMRGPVGTVVALNQRAKADSQMQIAMKLSMLEAQNTSSDCESPIGDTFIEPVPPGAALLGLVGGGQLPSVGSTTNDPWGVAYGYCGWDHGAIMGSGCSGGPLLNGNATGQGTVIAVISAGPDRKFGVTCVNGPALNAPYITRGANGADDLVTEMTYAEANEASGGLWRIKSGNPDQITTDRELDVQQGAQFSSGAVDFSGTNTSVNIDSGVALDLSEGGLFMLPNEDELGACNAANKGLLRRFVNFPTDDQEVLQICDGVTWMDIGGGGAAVAAVGDDGEIQFNDGGVAGVGGVMASDPGLKFNSAGGLTVGGNSTFSGDINLGDDLSVTGDGDFDGTLSVTGNSILTGTLDVDGATDIDDILNVTGNADFGAGIDIVGILRNDNGSAGAPSYTFTAAPTTGLYYSSGGIGFGVGGINEMTLSASGLDVTDLNISGAGVVGGNFNVGGNLTTNSLTVNDVINADRFLSVMGATSAALPGFQTEPGTGMFSAADNTLSLVTGGASRLVVDSTGDVGIGVPIPNAMLDVGGEIKVGRRSWPAPTVKILLSIFVLDVEPLRRGILMNSVCIVTEDMWVNNSYHATSLAP